ncbi:MAG: OB-fold domain-containing protein [Pseudomonadota bacterium]
MSDDPFALPLPEPSIESRPYWDGLNEGKLLIQTCAACSQLRHYPRPVCPHCYSFDYRWTEVSGRGTIHSWTVSHHAFHPAFKQYVPYTLLTVDLAEGVRMVAPVREMSDEPLALAQPVQVEFETVEEGVTLPIFRRVEG